MSELLLSDLMFALTVVGAILVAVLFWVSLRNGLRAVRKQITNLIGRHDHHDRLVTDLKRDYYELAREFSEFRGEIRGLMNAPNAPRQDNRPPQQPPG